VSKVVGSMCHYSFDIGIYCFLRLGV